MAKDNIRLTTTTAEIKAMEEEFRKRVERVIIRSLKRIGEECLIKARTGKSGKDYKDQTGNLRSSTGYVIVKDGMIVGKSAFKAIKTGEDGAAGGLAYAESLAANYPKGFALIFVAGMHYAVYVKCKGYDVIDSAELCAEKLVNDLQKDKDLAGVAKVEV